MLHSRTASVLSVALGVAMMAAPVFAQDSTAGEEMHQSGQAAKNAASESGSSVKHAANAAVDQAEDAALTTKVNAALLKDIITRKYSIKVESDQGNVTLQGQVASPNVADYAARLVLSQAGVKKVDNQLAWPMADHKPVAMVR